MKVNINSARLQAGLKALTRLAKPEVVNLEFEGKTLTMRGASEASSCMLMMYLEEKVKEALDVTVDLNLLQSVIDKTKDLTLSMDGSQLIIKSKSYEASVVSVETTPIVVVPDEVLSGEDGITLKTSFMNELLKVLPAMELKPLLSTYSEVPIGVRSTEEGTIVACFDFIQSAIVKLPELKGSVEFMLPSVTQFNMLAKELSGQKYKMVITDTTLYAWNDRFQISLSLPQQDGEQLTLDDPINLMSALDDMKFVSLSLSTEAVQKFLGNSRSVYDKDSSFTLDAEGESATMFLEATVGSMKLKTKLPKATKKVNFKVDLTFFQSIVGKTKEKVIHLKVNENLLRLRVGPVTYLMSLI